MVDFQKIIEGASKENSTVDLKIVVDAEKEYRENIEKLRSIEEDNKKLKEEALRASVIAEELRKFNAQLITQVKVKEIETVKIDPITPDMFKYQG